MIPPTSRTAFRGLPLLFVVALAAFASVSLLGRAEAAVFTSRSIGSGVIEVNGLDFSFFASTTDNLGSSLSLSLTEVDDNGTPGTADDVRRTERYSFSFPANAVIIDADLQSASIDTGTGMGPFGKLDLTFNAEGALERDTFDCGSFRSQGGAFAGVLNFKPRQNGLPNRINRSSIPGQITESKFKTPCETPPGDCFFGSSMQGSILGEDGSFDSFFVFKNASGANYSATFTDSPKATAPASISHSIDGPLPKSAFRSAATLRTGKFAPVNVMHVSGVLNFLANADLVVTPNDCGKNKFRTGTLAGEMTFETLTGDHVFDGSLAAGNLSASTP